MKKRFGYDCLDPSPLLSILETRFNQSLITTGRESVACLLGGRGQVPSLRAILVGRQNIFVVK